MLWVHLVETARTMVFAFVPGWFCGEHGWSKAEDHCDKCAKVEVQE